VTETVPFESDRWEWNADLRRLGTHLGREAVFLQGGFGTIPDAALLDGVIEVDLAVTGEREFVGPTWRVQDAESFEWFWVRPHQVGNPDATQYSPVFNGLSGWQLYHGERYTVATSFPFDEWFRVRIRFQDDRAEISLSGEIVLIVDDLKREPTAGGVGIGCGNLVGAHFANFAFGPLDGRIERPRRPPDSVLAGTIGAWSVSDAFPEDAIETALDPERRWMRLEAEPSGLADLARVNGIEDGRNTVLARATIQSDREQTKRLELGFSDRARVFLNGAPLYAGDDTYRSRDYRFLGSIGFWDSVFLPLREGENDLVIAVSESFGGWGLMARLEDLDGIRLGE
jgi:hypothetical protein